jgi:integrase
MNITEKSARTVPLPDGVRDRIYFDDAIRGFGVRVRDGDQRAWIFQYRIGRKQRRMTLGAVGGVPLALAKKNAAKLEAEVRLGRDPAGQRDINKKEAEYTFATVAERFLDARRPELRPATITEYERHIRRDCASLHRLPIANVTQADVARLLNNAPGAVTANRLRSTLSALFTWTLKEGVVLPRGNPAAFTNKRQEVSRDRVLSNPEIKKIWKCLGEDDYGNILKLLLLTGARENEIAALRWDEIKDSAVDLPAERVKNGRKFTIPLSSPAKAIIDSIERGKRVHVFGRDDTGFWGWANCKKRLDKQLGDMPHFTVHDFRRTVATGMIELGVQPHVVEAVLNHVSGHKAGVAGIYNRSQYGPEKVRALDLWAEHVMALVEGRKSVVVPMKRG